MTDSTPTSSTVRKAGWLRGRRLAPLAWISGAVAAGLLVLGASGTLSSWTTAIIGNNTNTVAVSNAVILKETGPGATPATCQSSTSGVSNNYTCSTINKYGGTATPLSPGASQSVAVTMTNVGSEVGSLTLAAGTCTPTGGIASGSTSVCDALQVAVACPTGTATYPATGTATLNQFAAVSSTTVTSLAANASVTCTFTVTLPSSTSPTAAGQTASQPLTWTLSGS